jgi:hypothetical protein
MPIATANGGGRVDACRPRRGGSPRGGSSRGRPPPLAGSIEGSPAPPLARGGSGDSSTTPKADTGGVGWVAWSTDDAGGISSTSAAAVEEAASRAKGHPSPAAEARGGKAEEEPPRATEQGVSGVADPTPQGEGGDVRGGRGEEDPPRSPASPAPSPRAGAEARAPSSAPTRAASEAAARLAAAGVVRARVHTRPLAGLSKRGRSPTRPEGKGETEETASRG